MIIKGIGEMTTGEATEMTLEERMTGIIEDIREETIKVTREEIIEEQTIEGIIGEEKIEETV